MVAVKPGSAKKGAEMERLTSNKTTSDMNMLELAHNSCYIDEKHNARYRDYEQDIDSRELVRKLVKDMCDEDLSYMSDERFDQYMAEMLSVGVSDTIGLLAVFYRNLWAMAELREKLKEYEDLEEQGKLVILPCKIGDTYYSIEVNTDSCEECAFFQKGYYCDDWCTNNAVRDEDGDTLINPQYSDKAFCKKHFYEINKCCFDDIDEIFNLRQCFGKTVFLTKSEAEAKLKELRGKNE